MLSIHAIYEFEFEAVTNGLLGVLYASTKSVHSPKDRLDAAIALLLSASFGASGSDQMVNSASKPEVLFQLYYDQSRASTSNDVTGSTCALPSSSLDLAFDDSVLDNVEDAWSFVNKKTNAEDKEETPYMVFKSREQFDDDDE